MRIVGERRTASGFCHGLAGPGMAKGTGRELTVRRGALEGALAESGGRKKMWQISSGAYYAEQKSFSLFPAMLFRVMNLSKYSGLVFI